VDIFGTHLDNLKTYSTVVHEYNSFRLSGPEQIILRKFKDRWHKFRMLDIGVGRGRTSHVFSALVKEYHGIDYCAPMIDACKGKGTIIEYETVDFHVCDARDLSQFYGATFDFILFSQNGIDSVDDDTRIKILSEVRKVLNVEGYFFFSTHSLLSFFPIRKTISPFIATKPVRSAYRVWKDVRFLMRKRWLYRNADADSIAAQDWAVLITGDHNVKMKAYHIRPDHQVRQLREVGLSVESVYDCEGNLVDPLQAEAVQSPCLHFLCRLGADAADNGGGGV